MSPSPGDGHTSGLPGTPEEQRAQRLAIAFKGAGFDDETRHEFIGSVTKGRVHSGKNLTDEEAHDVFQALRRVEEGSHEIRYDEEGVLSIVPSYDPASPW